MNLKKSAFLQPWKAEIFQNHDFELKIREKTVIAKNWFHIKSGWQKIHTVALQSALHCVEMYSSVTLIYMKSILANLRKSKTTIFDHFEGFEFWFLKM